MSKQKESGPFILTTPRGWQEAGECIVKKTRSVDGTTIVVRRIRVGPITHPAPIPDPGERCGLVSIDASNNGGVSTYYYTFMSEKADQVAPPNNSKYKELSGSTSSQPITMHPNFDSLYATYGKDMKNGRVVWLDKDPNVSGGGSLSMPKSTVNPLLGVDNYYKAGSVYLETDFRASRGEVEDSFVSHVARISDPPGVSATGPNQWLGLGLTITSIGSGYRVDRKWVRDERGWLTELYR